MKGGDSVLEHAAALKRSGFVFETEDVIPRGKLLEAADRMAAELTIYLHPDQARYQANQIAQALAGLHDDPNEDLVSIVAQVLQCHLDEHAFHVRVQAIVRTTQAWTRVIEGRELA